MAAKRRKERKIEIEGILSVILAVFAAVSCDIALSDPDAPGG